MHDLRATMTQPGLFDHVPPPASLLVHGSTPEAALSTERCDVVRVIDRDGTKGYERCPGTVTTQRTANPFEDVWACDTCPAHGSVSWSRTNSDRVREVTTA